ncbi:hypothetical protein BD779DRAFT_299285 [Infundibulicybe gibba]|nr:hypothetical protein BD779DRAFT_299285 [Infundibulicybe gibba]
MLTGHSGPTRHRSKSPANYTRNQNDAIWGALDVTSESRASTWMMYNFHSTPCETGYGTHHQITSLGDQQQPRERDNRPPTINTSKRLRMLLLSSYPTMCSHIPRLRVSSLAEWSLHQGMGWRRMKARARGFWPGDELGSGFNSTASTHAISITRTPAARTPRRWVRR